MNELDPNAALIVVDVQNVFNDPQRGRRNNPEDIQSMTIANLHDGFTTIVYYGGKTARFRAGAEAQAGQGRARGRP